MQCYRYYRQQLTQQEQNAYDALVSGIRAQKRLIDTPAFPAEGLNKIIAALSYDYPMFYYVNFSGIRLHFERQGWRFSIAYRYEYDQVHQIEQRILSIVKPCVDQARELPQKQAIAFLHDWLVRRCKYGTLVKRPYAAHNITGPFLDSICVCEGYAKAFKYLCDQVKTPCAVVCGMGGHPNGSMDNHAWNLIKLEGQFYHVDVTFDHLLMDQYCSRAYYLLSTNEILTDHVIDRAFSIPDCPISGNSLRTVHSTQELLAFLKQEATTGNAFSEVRMTKGFQGEYLKSMINKRLSLQDMLWASKMQSYYYADYARTLIVCWKV